MMVFHEKYRLYGLKAIKVQFTIFNLYPGKSFLFNGNINKKNSSVIYLNRSFSIHLQGINVPRFIPPALPGVIYI